jgi:hypothetical protein
MSQSIQCLTRPIQGVLLVFLAAGSALGIWGCAPTVTPSPTPIVTMEPSPTFTATVTPSPTASETLEPTLTPPSGYVIPDTVGTVDGHGNYSHIQPGDRLLIPSSRTAPVTFKNLKGEEGNRIVIMNYGGKVRIDAGGNWAGVQLQNCKHVRLTGTGDPSIEYGFEIFNVTNCGVTTNVVEGSQYLEIDHVEVHDSDGAGVRSGQAGDQTRETWRGVGFYLHHNYVHDVDVEGFYVGSSHWWMGVDPEIEGVEVAYNRVERCGWDGIQVGSAVKDVKVHHNYIKDVGLAPELGDGNGRSGLVINQGTTGDWYNNMVINAGKRGIMVQGIGGYRIFNNVIVDAGSDETDDAAIRWFGGHGRFFNNTIVNSRGDGIKVSSGRTGAIYDNIVVGSSGQDITNSEANAYNNIVGEVGAVGFVDPGNDDFHLLSESPAVDAGSGAGFAPFDYDDVPRPQGSKSDIGAFEFVGD